MSLLKVIGSEDTSIFTPFAITTYVGNGTSQTINMENGSWPGIIWIKCRDEAHWWTCHDEARNITKRVSVNVAAAEANLLDTVTNRGYQFFNVGSNVDVNVLNKNYIAYTWQASGGSDRYIIDTPYSKEYYSSASGASVFKYTGDGVNGRSLPHHLGVAPSLIFAKNRYETDNWTSYWKPLTSLYKLESNTLQGKITTGHYYDTEPTASVVRLGSGGQINATGESYIMYMFTDIPGKVKVGSYIGNGSTTGTIVNCGFRPRFLLIKNSTSGASTEWVVKDTIRDPTNPVDPALFFDIAIEDVNYASLDILSSGFQLKNSWETTNGSGQSYVYLAIT